MGGLLRFSGVPLIERFAVRAEARFLTGLLLAFCTCADAYHDEIAVAGIEIAVVSALRYHHALILFDFDLIAVFIEHAHLAFQDNKRVVLVRDAYEFHFRRLRH